MRDEPFSSMTVPTRDELRLRCGDEFDISVSHTVEVQICDKYNNAEQEKMMNGLTRKWFVQALTECGTLSDCSNPEIVDFQPAPGNCVEEDGKKYWTQTAIFTTKCVP